MPRLAAAGLLVLGTACQSSATPRLALSEAGEVGSADFPAPRHLLRGFDYRLPAGPWQVDDQVLFGLRLRKDGDVRNWLLRLRVTEVEALDDDGVKMAPVDWSLRINGKVETFASELCRAEVIVMDEAGKELGRSHPVLPRDFLSCGMASACRLVNSRMRIAQHGRVTRRRGPDGMIRDTVRGRVDVRPLAEATVSAVALLQVVQEDSVLAPILWQVIEKPSLWSVVTSMGVDVMLRPQFHRATNARCPVLGLHEKTWRLPIGLEVNSAPALDLDLFVTDSTPPFTPAGGLLGATARHPTDATLDFSLLLLSARRG